MINLICVHVQEAYLTNSANLLNIVDKFIFF